LPDYLLDTTAIIDYLRDKSSVPELLEKLCSEGGLLGCSPVNREIANLAGDLKRKYSRKGITLSTPDVLIAATAIKKHLILVTNNPKHFPIEGLMVFNYER
jgi:predicted nucleic acid-binding protein